MSHPRSLFYPLDSNCPKQRRIFNFCNQVDLKTIKLRKELYTDPRGIKINQTLLIDQLIWIVNPSKEEKQIHTTSTNVRKSNQIQVVITIELFSFVFVLKQT